MANKTKVSDRGIAPTPSRTHSSLLLLGTGLLAGSVAAGATVATAATARAADVSLEIAGKAVPFSAFPFWTMVGTLIGIALAAALRQRRRFIQVTVAAAGLSLVPPVFSADEASTALVLVATHLIAAAIVIPALSLRLTAPQDTLA